jgi:GNAT superfamily N-acetyltransferase
MVAVDRIVATWLRAGSDREAYYRAMELSYKWRGPFDDAEVNALHAEGFGHPVRNDDWKARVERHSLGWVCAYAGDDLVGFVNVPWDGGAHAFIVDVLVSHGSRRHGVGTRIIAVAAEEARAAGCEWLHADFDDELIAFYLDSCGLISTPAGLIAL